MTSGMNCSPFSLALPERRVSRGLGVMPGGFGLVEPGAPANSRGNIESHGYGPTN